MIKQKIIFLIKKIKFLFKKEIDDEEIVISLIKQKPTNLELASNRLKNNKKFMLMLDANIWHYENNIPTKYINWIIYYSGETLKKDKDYILELLKNKASLRFVIDSHKNDKDIVLKALENDPKELLYASTQLKNDKEFILSIAGIKNLDINHISKRLQNDREVFIEFLKQNWTILKFAKKEFKDDEEIALIAVKHWFSTANMIFGYEFEFIESNYVHEYVSERIKEIFKYDNYYEILEKTVDMKNLDKCLIKKENNKNYKPIKV